MFFKRLHIYDGPLVKLRAKLRKCIRANTTFYISLLSPLGYLLMASVVGRKHFGVNGGTKITPVAFRRFHEEYVEIII